MTRRDFVKRAGLWVPVAGLVTLPRRALASTAYFGQQTISDQNGEGAVGSNMAGYNVAEASGNVNECPGSGSQSVVELGVYLLSSGYSGSIRLAIYTASGDFVAQGSAAIALSSWYATQWYSHTSFVDQSGAAITNPTLTGGASYRLAFSINAGGTLQMYGVWLSGNGLEKASTDLTGGFPATLGSGWSNTSYSKAIRCGVTPSEAPPSSSGSGRRKVVIL